MTKHRLACVSLLLSVAAPLAAQQAGQNVPVLPVVQPQRPAEGGPPSPDSVWEAALEGDLFMQRQLEPTIAVSTRNPNHLLTFFNDYRAVDIKDDLGLGERLAKNGGSLSNLLRRLFRRPAAGRALPAAAAASEAWIGMSRSFDGGQTWSGGIMPGSLVDPSPASLAAPIHGLEAAADSVAHAAPCGLVHVAFLAFTRGGASKMALATWEDLNNAEGQDTFVYRGMTVIESANNATNGYFLDKPSIVVDPARGNAAGCGHTIYVSYTVFNGLEKDGKFKTKVVLARSTDAGRSFTTQKLNMPFIHNQGTALAVDPRPGTPSTTGGGTVYLAWRHFYDPDTMMVLRSQDYGQTWPGQPVSVTGGAPIYAFDQPTIGTTAAAGDPTALAFRSNAYPSLAVTDTGRIFLAWQERVDRSTGLTADGGSPRIVLTSSANWGTAWSGRQAVDWAPRDSTPQPVGIGLLPQARPSGPQVMPKLVFGGGQLLLTYYESRGLIVPYVPAAGESPAVTERIAPADLTPPGYITGIDRVADVRAALLDPASGVLWGSSQVSRYPLRRGALQPNEPETLDKVAAVNAPCIPDNPEGIVPCVRRVNRVNVPHSSWGTTPFIGDYIDAAAVVQFVPDGDRGWRWAAGASDVPYQGFHTVFADNRNQVPPAGGLAAYPDYAPPGSGGASCVNPGSRNTDVFTSNVNTSMVVTAPQTYKQTGTVTRAFPVYVSNQSAAGRYVRFETAAGLAGVSFSPTTQSSAVVAYLFPYSGATRVVYLSPAVTSAVAVRVCEINGADAPTCATGAFSGTTWINFDASNPWLSISDQEVHTPGISTPGISTPGISTPGISTPGISTPGISTPGISTPGISTPGISTPGISTATLSEIVDVTWSAWNLGNTTSGYLALVNVDNAEQYRDDYGFQLFVYKTAGYAALDGCSTRNQLQDQLLVNMPLTIDQLKTPGISTPGISTPGISTATFYEAPYAPGSSGGSGASVRLASTAQGEAAGDGTTQAPPNGGLRITLRAYPLRGAGARTSVYDPVKDPPSMAVIAMACYTDGSCPRTSSAPDLVVSSGPPTLGTTTVRAGTAIPFVGGGWTMTNEGNYKAEAELLPGGGTETTAYRHGLYLLPVAGTGEAPRPIWLAWAGSTDIPLEPGDSQSFEWPTVVVPADIDAGDYMLAVMADYEHRVSEVNETNNVAALRITVLGGDAEAPALTLPGSISNVEATSPAGATVTFTATASDNVDGNVPVSCSPASGSTFRLGTTTVTCSATDSASNTGTGSFDVTVRDSRPPVVTVPANITVEATGPHGSAVTFTATALDIVGGAVTPTCTRTSGSVFPLGVTVVNCSAADAAGNVASGSFTVTVRDTTRPAVTLSVTPTTIWSPNGSMVTVTASGNATDAGSGIASVRYTVADEYETIQPAGTVTPGAGGDYEVGIPLQASRRGNDRNGRKYTITVSVTDAAGLTMSASVVVVAVEHDQSK